MSKNKVTINDIQSASLPAFRRAQWFETAKTIIQIVLMATLALALIAFLSLLVISGVTTTILPDTEGVRSLLNLFIEITSNAKTVVLFAIGFFFREYLHRKSFMK